MYIERFYRRKGDSFGDADIIDRFTYDVFQAGSMLPGIGGKGMSPKKMKQMMKQMGISIEEIEGVEEVVIKTADKEIVFQDVAVTIMIAQGNKSYQIVGTPEERARALTIPDADVELVVAQTGVSPEEARSALEECHGDLAEAIVKLGAE